MILKSQEKNRLAAIYNSLEELKSLIQERGDIPLQFGNGSVCAQLDCALLSLDRIYLDL